MKKFLSKIWRIFFGNHITDSRGMAQFSKTRETRGGQSREIIREMADNPGSRTVVHYGVNQKPALM
jgi:hypothetical protein